jgi:hypothetical protein
VGRGVVHPPGGARRADASALARERQQAIPTDVYPLAERIRAVGIERLWRDVRPL